MTNQAGLDVLTIGRSGVDIYPLQTGVHLEDVESFGKFLGGSPTNVAVAAARLGHTSGVITGVGDDPFGRFVQREMRRLGVSDANVVTVHDFHTPVTFPLYFYREPSAPDLEVLPQQVDWAAVENAKIFWFTVTGLSRERSLQVHTTALSRRDKRPYTIVDLDYRENLWAYPQQASERVWNVLESVDVAIGNREECAVAVGETEPERAADALLERGVELAIVKQGPRGTLAKTRDESVWVPATKVNVTNGLGAGDAFGGSICHGLLEGWGLEKMIKAASLSGALVASRLECSTAMPTRAELETMLETGDVL